MHGLCSSLRYLALLSIACCAFLLFPPKSTAESKPVVVTTTSIIADTARQVGGDYFEISSIMGEGVDPHLYKASPGDMKRLLSADIILHNGLHLEGKMADALKKLSDRKKVVEATRSIPRKSLHSPPGLHDAYDPHVWFAPLLWQHVVDVISQEFSQLATEHNAQIIENGSRTKASLHDLDAWIKQEVASIPADRRLLVTAHDAFGYFGRTYGLEVLSIQGMSTDSEASLQEINALVDTIVNRGVPAVFVESSVPQKTIRALVEGALARNHQVTIGGELFSDALGKMGTEVGTLDGVIRYNVNTISEALRGHK